MIIRIRRENAIEPVRAFYNLVGGFFSSSMRGSKAGATQ
jgi:hypothetical protein